MSTCGVTINPNLPKGLEMGPQNNGKGASGRNQMPNSLLWKVFVDLLTLFFKAFLFDLGLIASPAQRRHVDFVFIENQSATNKRKSKTICYVSWKFLNFQELLKCSKHGTTATDNF